MRSSRSGRGPLAAMTLIPAIALVAMLASACGSSKPNTTASAAANLGTSTPGTIRVAIEDYMPYSGEQNGKLTGLDTEILTAAAEKLHQKITFFVTDFAGTLAAVQSGRADMTLGSVTWTAARAKTGLFTDPTYYSPAAALVKKGTSLQSTSDFAGGSVGMLSGSTFEQGIEAVPGASGKFYSGVAEALTDLQNGRIKAYLTDPLVAAYAAKVHASAGLTTAYFAPPTADQIKANSALGVFSPYEVAFYLNQHESKLQVALDQQIDAFYKNGVLSNYITQWGGDPKAFLTPTAALGAERQGVDRPENWVAPTLSSGG